VPLTDLQQAAIRLALAPALPRLRRAAPPERARLLREALERAVAIPTRAERDAYADEAHGG